MNLPDPSFSRDVDFVSAYLPYCDVMFIEKTCADILTSNPAKPQVPESARVFSRRSGNAFIAFLRDLEASVSAEQRALVQEVYGADWDRPDLEIFFS